MWSDDWISTFSPELARLTEQAMENGTLPQNLQYAVPRAWAEANPGLVSRTVWVYDRERILVGGPIYLTSERWATDL